MLCNGVTNPEQVGSKMVIVCCDRLLLAHSANFIKLNSVVVKIFLVRLFCAPSSAAPGGNCPSAPLSYATDTANVKLSSDSQTIVFQRKKNIKVAQIAKIISVKREQK